MALTVKDTSVVQYAIAENRIVQQLLDSIIKHNIVCTVYLSNIAQIY